MPIWADILSYIQLLNTFVFIINHCTMRKHNGEYLRISLMLVFQITLFSTALLAEGSVLGVKEKDTGNVWSYDICMSLMIKTETVCRWKSCQTIKQIVFYSVNGTIFKSIVRGTDNMVNVNKLKDFYQIKKVYYKCLCGDLELSNGTLHTSRLPLPISKSEMNIYYDRTIYAVNVSFPVTGRYIQQTYKVHGSQKLGGDIVDVSTASCTKEYGMMICPEFLKNSVNIYHTISYTILSHNDIGECTSKSWNKEVSIFDMCGPPVLPSVSEIGQDFVKLKIPKPYCDFSLTNTVELCISGACKNHKLNSVKAEVYTISGLAPLTEYSFRNRYEATFEESEWTEWVKFTTLSKVPSSKPQSLSCLSNKEGFLVSWMPPRASSSIIVNKYMVEIEDSNTNVTKVFLPSKKHPPYKLRLKINTSLISVSILPCSNGGCATKSLAGYTTNCMKKAKSRKQSTSTDSKKKIYMYSAIGVGTGIIVFFIIVAALYFTHLMRKEKRKNIASGDPGMFDNILVVDPRGQYERALISRGNRPYVGIGQDSECRLVDASSDSSGTESTIGSLV